MAQSGKAFDDDYWQPVRELIAGTFVFDNQADLFGGPSFRVWEPSRTADLEQDLPEGRRRASSLPFARYGKAYFQFSQKYLHVMAINDDALAVTTTIHGRPVRIQQFAKRKQFDRFMDLIDAAYVGDEWYCRWIPSKRFRDALVVSRHGEHNFIPVDAAITQGDLRSLSFEEYLRYVSEG